MKEIKRQSAKGQQLVNTYRVRQGVSLNEVYSSFSRAKEKAYYDCLRMCNEENGYDFHICSHNTNYFTVGWTCEDINGHEFIRMETAYNSYIIR